MDSRHFTRRDALRSLAAASFGLTSAARKAIGALLGTTSGSGGPPDESALRASGWVPGRSAGEILIRGGRVVNAEGVRDADVRTVGEEIVEVGAGLAPGPETEVIEAAGHLVLPGGVDPHTHLHPPFVDDLTTGSAAALAGGITTVGTFYAPEEGEDTLAALERTAARVHAEAMADVILHAATWPPGPDLLEALPELARRGQPSVKLYTLRRDFDARLAEVVELLAGARDAGVLTMIHCEDAAILEAASRRLEAAGAASYRHYGESRPVAAEVAATERAAGLCAATGAPMHVVHLSSARALEACRNPGTRGLPLTVETRPLYLHLTEERLAGPEAGLYVGQPPLRTAADAAALWRGLADGRVDMLATDHAPWTRAQKLDPELTLSRLRPGVSDLRFMLPLYFSEGVGKGRITPERFVETTATAAARAFGLYPRKGVIAPGALADVVVWDPRRTAPVRAVDDPSRSDYSVYEGWEVTGWPVLALRRGEVVFRDGAVTAEPGSGRLLERRGRAD